MSKKWRTNKKSCRQMLLRLRLWLTFFEKIIPDMTLEEMDVGNVVMETGTDGLIVTNTTNARPEILPSKHWKEIGGLLGAPLKINPRNAFAPCTNLPMAKS
jgi:dihydroorotate dehydrogenase